MWSAPLALRRSAARSCPWSRSGEILLLVLDIAVELRWEPDGAPALLPPGAANAAGAVKADRLAMSVTHLVALIMMHLRAI